MSDDLTPAGRASLLVIGYGNTLRRDDGIGPKVAEAVAALNLTGVRALACHQLTPELAGPISQADAVIFVDAAVPSAGGIGLREIAVGLTGQTFAHAPDPGSLLALAKQVFGRCPRAWTLAIPVEDLGFGDGLSPRAATGLPAAVEQIRTFLNKSREAAG